MSRRLMIVLFAGACSGPPEGTNPFECQDFQDNDNDRLVDCADPDCVLREQCVGREGLDASECVDGLDNDQDGYYDCFDFDCFAAPLCTESGGSVVVVPGVGTPGGGGGGGVVTETPPDDAFIHAPMQSADLTLSVSFDMDEFGDSLCAFSQVCDCTVSLAGSGTFLEGETNRATFTGSWGVASTDCSPASGLANAIWSQSSGDAFHTFRWSDDGATLEEWIVHQFVEDTVPFTENQNDQGQFWVAGMRAAYPGLGTEISYTETKIDLADLIYITTVFDLDVTFQ